VSNDQIRAAAALLRERATAAAPVWDLDVTGAFNGAFDTSQEYLDTVPPAAGLVLADMLDAMAGRWLSPVRGTEPRPDDAWWPVQQPSHALTLARLILGEA
jgi:hypothetical protein